MNETVQRVRRSKALRVFLRWLVLLVCLAFIGSFLHGNWAKIRDEIQFRPLFFAYLVGLHFVSLLIHGWRYHIALEHSCGRPLPFWRLMKLFVLGRFLNTLAPQAGNVFRGMRLKSELGVSITDYVGSLVAFAWIVTTMNLAAAATTVAVVAPGMELHGWPMAPILGLAAIAMAVGPALLDVCLRLLPFAEGRLLWLRERTRRVLRASLAATHHLGFLFRSIAASLFIFAQACVTIFVCFRAIDVPTSIGETVVFYALFQMLSYVNLTPANIGIAEVGSEALTSALGLAVGAGMVAAALLRVAGTLALVLVAVPLGGLDLLRRRRSEPGSDPAA